MKALSLSIALGLVFATHCNGAEEPFAGKQSAWNGYAKWDFDQDGRNATVVVPKKPAADRPWLWRGEFFGAFPSVDLALLEKGYHVVYLNCANTFGSPDTLKRWDAFYERLTTKHGLSKKPVLLGMSRGGLYVYRWAAQNPDKVGLIYGDAPVCDIKSWPGGKGKGKGAPNEWKNFLKVYNFTEEEGLAWKGNPIDVLEPIAKAKIPVIHVCGMKDDVVPVEENTTILKERYEKLGGTFELIAKEGVGHHPHSLADPKPIVEFIEKNRITK
jgi:pimeloyl-ACP methyl ester carboxylesterase